MTTIRFILKLWYYYNLIKDLKLLPNFNMTGQFFKYKFNSANILIGVYKFWQKILSHKNIFFIRIFVKLILIITLHCYKNWLTFRILNTCHYNLRYIPRFLKLVPIRSEVKIRQRILSYNPFHNLLGTIKITSGQTNNWPFLLFKKKKSWRHSKRRKVNFICIVMIRNYVWGKVR